MNAEAKIHGIMAEFETTADVKHAATVVRDAGFRNWDVYTPFPIHGLDDAMGLRKSPVGWFTFIGGITGFTTGMSMIWFMNAFDYPLIIGGKPLFSPVYAFPVSYELTILFGAFGSILGMLLLNRLPRWHHPLLKTERFKRATHDRFYIVIESADPKFSSHETKKLLEEAGGGNIELVED